jgi:hypothetical protein
MSVVYFFGWSTRTREMGFIPKSQPPDAIFVGVSRKGDTTYRDIRARVAKKLRITDPGVLHLLAWDRRGMPKWAGGKKVFRASKMNARCHRMGRH